ncbi:MAG: isoprenylcysteine carboxylmethyltransferase family protein [Acetobacteraceae bacterium]|nr:isoprenylcysteine carboxylmethyltransferase family protein [Acetobacteraceae bacterium]
MRPRARFILLSFAQIPVVLFVMPYLMILAIRGLEGLLGMGPAFPPPWNGVAFALASAWGAVWMSWSIYYIHAAGQGGPAEAAGKGIRPTVHLMRGGPYAFCRNPMMHGYTVAFPVGLGFLLRSWAVFIFVPLWLGLVHVFLTRVEEPELERRFGDEYREYRAGLPRLMLRMRGARARLAAARHELAAVGPKSPAGLALAGVLWVLWVVSLVRYLPSIAAGSAAALDILSWLPLLLHLTWYGFNLIITVFSLGALPRFEK